MEGMCVDSGGVVLMVIIGRIEWAEEPLYPHQDGLYRNQGGVGGVLREAYARLQSFSGG